MTKRHDGRQALAAGLMLGAMSLPALAIGATPSSVTCAASVTTGIGGQQELRDLDPSDLPVLAYSERPTAAQSKALMKIEGQEIRLYVYRVNASLLHLQIFEDTDAGKAVLGDTPVSGDTTEMTWAPLGGHEQVTVYCY